MLSEQVLHAQWTCKEYTEVYKDYTEDYKDYTEVYKDYKDYGCTCSVDMQGIH